MRLVRLIGRRLLLLVPVLIGVSIVTFALTRVLPGSPVDQLAGPMATPEQRQRIMRAYGLDRPLPEQYLTYMGGLLRWDFGTSFVTNRPVAVDLRAFFPATLELTTVAIALATLIGIPLGVLGAVRRGTVVDHAVRVLAVGGVAVPNFWLSLVLIYLLFYTWRLLPAPVGRLSLQIRPPPEVTGLLLVDSTLAGNWAALGSAAAQLTLPVLVLAFGAVAPIARMARSSMLDVLDSAHIRAARAFGIPGHSLIWKYALKNAILPVLTILSVVYGFLLGGSVLVENIFAWPGLGRYAFNAISANDYPAVQGFILYTTLVYVVIFLLVDLGYALLDPRIAD